MLHLSDDGLEIGIRNVILALKKEGVFFVSFKHGTSQRIDSNGRFFNDMTLSRLNELLNAFDDVCILDNWKSIGGSGLAKDSHWLNVIIKKN